MIPYIRTNGLVESVSRSVKMPYTKAVLNIVILDLYSGEIFGPDHPV